ncbi:MAG TPA: MBL fold metallo-hydrolase [Candidatus Thermoplasmatota archaeon]|nr:MBL fold metallo-hydrolase [Candidatus Thermoplasmatota archaeon]
MPRLRRASAVVLARRDPLEVYLVRRSPEQKFFPDYWAFPGGTLDEGEDFAQAALREMVEETGVWLASSVPAALDREKARGALLAGDAEGFAAMLAGAGGSLAAGRLVPAARLVTPEFSPARYDTQFYAAWLPPGEMPSIVPGELVDGAWFAPAEALARWARHEMLIAPPAIAILTALAEHGLEEAAARMRAEDGKPHHERFRVWFHPGIHVLPLRTPTLAPATTTNFVCIGRERVLLVDPGCGDREGLAVLEAYVRGILDEGSAVEGIVLTHHHPDHVAGVPFLKERFGFPVMAHAETAKRVSFPVDRRLGDGDILELGRDENVGKNWRIRVLHTAGHTKGSISLLDNRFGAMVVGDLASSVSTIVVDPADGGDMGAYMRSLSRLADLSPSIVIPGHGPAVAGARLLTGTLEHRRGREAKVVEALKAGAATVEEMLPLVYSDVDASVWGLAARSLEAHLRKLEHEGRVREGRSRWTLA